MVHGKVKYIQPGPCSNTKEALEWPQDDSKSSPVKKDVRGVIVMQRVSEKMKSESQDQYRNFTRQKKKHNFVPEPLTPSLQNETEEVDPDFDQNYDSTQRSIQVD